MLVSMARRRNSILTSVIVPIDKSDMGTDKAIDTPVRYTTCGACVNEERDIVREAWNDTVVIVGIGVLVRIVSFCEIAMVVVEVVLFSVSVVVVLVIGIS